MYILPVTLICMTVRELNVSKFHLYYVYAVVPYYSVNYTAYNADHLDVYLYCFVTTTVHPLIDGIWSIQQDHRFQYLWFGSHSNFVRMWDNTCTGIHMAIKIYAIVIQTYYKKYYIVAQNMQSFIYIYNCCTYIRTLMTKLQDTPT